MTTSRLAIVLAVLLGGLSAVFLIPSKVPFMPVGVNLELPDSLGEWWGRPGEITEKERNTLGPETEFSRKNYSNGRGDSLQASVVLAGSDMMTSIHRPERCLNAQGWEFTPGDQRTIDIPGHGKLPVMRLKNHKLLKAPDGSLQPLENICYYWFAGSRSLTAAHNRRVWIDGMDRLFERRVQRWAMIMVTSDITSGRQRFGRDEKGADDLLVGFIQKLAPDLHKETIRYQ
jgi:EpsI family protein